MNLGIDLGSTYTILSTYRADHGKLEALEADTKSNVSIPSVISRNKKGIVGYGSFAKGQTGKRNIQTYKAFKMLLMESDKELVRERGYDEQHSPKWALSEFMNRIISKAQLSDNSSGTKSKIENLVVGAPNVWFHKFNTLGGRAVLKDICTGIEGVEDVRIVSEPVLASAYFAYNYQKVQKEPFNGTILIIDYGGGTLDLSLTKIDKGRDKSMEIKMLAFNGAGENTDHCIGNAGIVYHESLMEHILRKNNPEEADNIINTEEFFAAVNRLEEIMLMPDVNEFIQDTFDEIGTDYPEELEEEVIAYPVECDGEDYDITCRDLLDVYNDKIRNIFEEKMDEMIRMAKEEGIDPFHAFGNKFRIALVGGFGNFYLVRNQMREKFRFSSQDDREKDIIETAADRERAISYGAALVASGNIGICNTAPYTVGIRSVLNGKAAIDYMVRYKDEIELDRVYYINKIFCLTEDTLDDDFVIESNNKPILIALKDKYQKKLADEFSATDNGGLKTFKIGISFNNSEFMTLHIKPFLFMEQKMSDREITIELGELYDAFEEKKEV